MIIHHVFFWLKEPGVENREQLMQGLGKLRDIPSVRRIHIGTAAATEARGVVDASYDVSELLFFSDLEGQQAYQDHPLHKQFVADCSRLWKKVVVYDVESEDTI